MGLGAAPASATAIHPFLETLGSAAQPGHPIVGAVAVDQSTGDVLVVDAQNMTLSRYHANGTPDNFSALGTNVIDGDGAGDGTPLGRLSFGNAVENGIAIDNSGTSTDGNIYISQYGPVDIFSSTGSYLGQLTTSTEGSLENTCGIAVDSNGAVYVSSYGQVHKYVPSANPPSNSDNTANFYTEGCASLAAGSGPTAGFLFANGSGTVSKLDASTGEVQYVFGESLGAISLDPATGHLYAASEQEFAEYDASGAASATLVSTSPLQGFEDEFEVTGGGDGIAVRGSTGNVYVSRRNPFSPDERHVGVFGPLVTVPTATAQAADGITITAATLHGTVNPEGVAVTECKFEYGPANGGYPNSAPCDGSIPTDSSGHAVSASLSGIADAAGYHFRLVARNENGSGTSLPLSFATPPSLVVSIDAATGVTGTEATVHGAVNPQGNGNAVTECWFEYGPESEFPGGSADTSGYIYSIPCDGSIPTDASDHAVSAHLSDLPGDGSKWRFRLVAVNAYGSKKSGGETFTVDTTATAEPTTSVTQSTAVLNGAVKTDDQPFTSCSFEYGTDASLGESASCNPPAISLPSDFQSHPVSVTIDGLNEATTYYFRISTNAAGGRVQSNVVRFDTSGLPAVSKVSALEGQTTAVLGGYVDPNGWETTYHFEWGPTTSYGSSAPAGPEPSVGSESEPAPVSAQLGGLEVGQTYHFRLVATNSAGTSDGPDQTFSTYKDVGLPDSRAYEQVSPIDKNGGNVDALNGTSMASVDGNRLLFFSGASFAGQPTNFIVGTDYLATRRTNGWITEGIDPPGGNAKLGYQGFVPDLSMGVLKWDDDTRIGPYDPSAPRAENLYIRDSASRTFRYVDGLTGINEQEGFVGASGDFSHWVIKSSHDLIPGEPCPGKTFSEECTYEWDNGTLRLASILPDGDAVIGGPGGGAFIGSIEHVISADGRRMFFESPNPAGGDADLYVRENGSTTTLLSGSQRTLPGGAKGFSIDYQNSEAAHGDKVLFTTRNSLLNEDDNHTNDAYIYDFEKPAGERLTLISKDRNPAAPSGASLELGNQGHFGGIVGASDDLKRVYFVAANQIVPGEPEAEGPKLFLWDDTGSDPAVSYIGKLDPADLNVWTTFTSGAFAMRSARLDPTGRYLAFAARARLTPFENEGKTEVYRYDAVTNSLACVSCPSDTAVTTPAVPGANSLSFYRLGHGSPVNRELHNVSENGQVFFESEWDLLPRDSNGLRDVYEYEEGRVHLISKGTGDRFSTFLDATPSGSDVFFATGDRLVDQDVDNNIDAYDARISGGFAEPPPAPPCVGDACQPAPNVPNDPTPASSGFEGSGNVTEPSNHPRCAKRKERRHGRCVNRHHKHHRHAGNKRTATRSHG